MGQRTYNKGSRSWLGRFSFSNGMRSEAEDDAYRSNYDRIFAKPDPELRLGDRRLDYRGQRLRRVVRVKR